MKGGRDAGRRGRSLAPCAPRSRSLGCARSCARTPPSPAPSRRRDSRYCVCARAPASHRADVECVRVSAAEGHPWDVGGCKLLFEAAGCLVELGEVLGEEGTGSFGLGIETCELEDLPV